MASTTKIFFTTILTLAFAALIAASCGYLYLRSDAGQRLLEAQVEELASSPGLTLKLSGLNSNLISAASVRELRLKDRRGDWLILSDVEAEWSLPRLLRGAPPLLNLKLGQADLLRLPEKEAAPQETGGTNLKDLWNYLPEEATLGRLNISEQVSGAAQSLTGQAARDGARYRLSLSTLEGPATRLQASFDPGHIELHLDESPGGILSALASLPPSQGLKADALLLTQNDQLYHIEKARFEAGDSSIEFTGDYDMASAEVDGAATLSFPSLDVISGVSGSLEATLKLRGPADALAFELYAQTPHAAAQNITFENAVFQAKGSLNAASWADHPKCDATLQFQGNVNERSTQVSTPIALDGGTLSLAGLNATYGNVSGKASGTATGSMDSFRLEATTILHSPLGVSDLALRGTINTAEASYQGTASGSLATGKTPIAFAVEGNATSQQARLSSLSLKGPGVDASGAMTISFQPLLAEGQLTLDAPDLSPLGTALDLPLAGAATAQVRLERDKDAQSFSIDGSAQKLQAFGISVQSATVQATGQDLYTLSGLSAHAEAAGLSMDGFEASSFVAHAEGSLNTQLNVSAKGRGNHGDAPWSLSIAGQAESAKNDGVILNLSSLEGRYDDAPLRLLEPTKLSYSDRTVTLSPATLQLAGGSVTLHADLSGNRADGGLKLAQIELKDLPFLDLPPGRANGDVTLEGTRTKPLLRWNLSAAIQDATAPVEAQIKGSWTERMLETQVIARSGDATATAEVNVSAPVSLDPVNFGLSGQSPLQGRVESHLPLAAANSFLRASGQKLGGTIKGQATLAGTLGSPRIDGRFDLAGGSYDHRASGICLRGAHGILIASGHTLTLQSLEAPDRDGHKMYAEGSLIFADLTRLDARANFKEFRLFCGGRASGILDGSITARGNSEAMTLAGKLTAGPLNVQLPGPQGDTRIPEVKTVWVTPGGSILPSQGPSSIALDIRLIAPGRVFLRGRGLDAELEGRLHLRGTASDPRVSGTLNSRRGTYTFLDRTLKLNSATVTFRGPIPPSPFLNVTAGSTINGTEVSLNLTGSAQSPELSVSSNPSLPQDEALALLLFGRQLNRISAFEAIKLARATRVLAGYDDGGPGLIGNLRQATGLDTLDVGTDDDNNVTVTTGKYITDKVFVGVTQGAAPEDRNVVTEIELSPSVRANTNIDAKGNQGVGVQWKYDY